MRRTQCILALLAGAAAFTVSSSRAEAHFCSFPAEVKLNQPVTLNIGVGAELAPVRAVDITIPEGFEVEESFGYAGYVGERVGNKVRFEGAEIAAGACHYFGIAGQATRKGKLVATITTYAPDGTKVVYDDPDPASQFPAMVIFAGIPMVAEEAAGGSNTPVIAGVAVGAAALIGGGIVFWRRRRGKLGR